MSADNGIYILRTADPEYRVIHDKAIENLYWDPINRSPSNTLVPSQIIRYFGDAKSTKNANIAMVIACDLKKEIEKQQVLEYGICVIDSNLTWGEVIQTQSIPQEF